MAGVVYCAVSKTIYFKASLVSSIVFQRLNPGIPITIFHDQNLTEFLDLKYQLKSLGIDLVKLSISREAFLTQYIKTQLCKLSPYVKTLYLDADILPIRPIPDIWAYLELGDMALTLDRRSTLSECDHIDPDEITFTLKTISSNTKQFNSGVMLWQKTLVTQKLFNCWHKQWDVFKKHDQLAYIRAVSNEQFQVVEMPVHYNTAPFRFAPEKWPIDNNPYLLHCWGGQVRSGEFFMIAKQRYPDVVEFIENLLHYQN